MSKTYQEFVAEIAMKAGEEPTSSHTNDKRCPKHDWETVIDGNHIRNHKTTGKMLGVGHIQRCKVCGKERTVDYVSGRPRG